MSPSIREITAAETLDLRHRVLWPDRPRAHVMLEGDDTARHFGALEAGVLIGVASFFPDGARARLRKLAVDPGHRGRGVAGHMLEAAFEALRSDGCTEVWCDARVSARDFYVKRGFSVGADVFDKDGVDYVIAERRL